MVKEGSNAIAEFLAAIDKVLLVLVRIKNSDFVKTQHSGQWVILYKVNTILSEVEFNGLAVKKSNTMANYGPSPEIL